MRRCLRCTFVLAAAACASRQPEARTPAAATRTVVAAEHVALWYHGVSHLPRVGIDSTGIPAFDLTYVDSITAIKRRMGTFPTAVDERSAEFARAMEDEPAFAALQFLPLYFQDAEALFSSVRLWHRADGDPERAASGDAASVIAFLSSHFPRPKQRQLVAAWIELLAEEARTFFDAYWQGEQGRLDRLAEEVEATWSELHAPLANFLGYVQATDAQIFLVPALGSEGRSVRHRGRSRVAVTGAAHTTAETVVWSALRELVYGIAEEVVRDQVAPARLRESGAALIVGRTAIRGGAIVLEQALPEKAASYKRFYLAQVSHTTLQHDLDTAFAAAFPLSPDLERGLRQAVLEALAGI